LIFCADIYESYIPYIQTAKYARKNIHEQHAYGDEDDPDIEVENDVIADVKNIRPQIMTNATIK